jgi:general secretion pathway protein A
VDDQSDQPLAGDLSFLGDLDHGLDLSAGLDRDIPPEATRLARRRRPLLELFPAGPGGDAVRPPIIARSRVPAVAPTGNPIAAAPPRPRPVARGVRPTYEIFYGLNEKPFSVASDPRFLYHSTAHDRAAHEILAAIERRDGNVVLTGEAGIGKTTLCRLVIDELDARTFTSLVLDSFVTFDDFLKTVLIDFGVISHADLAGGRLSAASPGELTIVLKEFLQSLVPLNAFAVIFVDDAHNLAAAMLDHVRRLPALESDPQLIELVLVGEPGLLTRLDRPGGHEFDQPMTVRCDLGPLTEDEIAGYLIHRLVVSGGGPSRVEFDHEALTMIYQHSRGVPRLVNRLCDRALTLGFEQSASVIDAALVEAAARDLDLIPPEAASAKVWRFGVAAAALAGLMLLGASAATWIFGTRVQRVVAAWQAIPSAPPPPSRRMVRPVEVPLPDSGSPDGDVVTLPTVRR